MIIIIPSSACQSCTAAESFMSVTIKRWLMTGILNRQHKGSTKSSALTELNSTAWLIKFQGWSRWSSLFGRWLLVVGRIEFTQMSKNHRYDMQMSNHRRYVFLPAGVKYLMSCCNPGSCFSVSFFLTVTHLPFNLSLKSIKN